MDQRRCWRETHLTKRSYPMPEDTSPVTVKGVRGSSRSYGTVGAMLLDSGDAALSWDDIEPHSVDNDPEIVDHLRRFGGL